jgi:hypothetical protein
MCLCSFSFLERVSGRVRIGRSSIRRPRARHYSLPPQLISIVGQRGSPRLEVLPSILSLPATSADKQSNDASQHLEKSRTALVLPIRAVLKCGPFASRSAQPRRTRRPTPLRIPTMLEIVGAVRRLLPRTWVQTREHLQGSMQQLRHALPQCRKMR